MRTYQNLVTDLTDRIFTITINRPDKLNALNIQTIAELKQAMQEVYDNDEVRGVIITGAGPKSFVAGADISEIAKLDNQSGKELAAHGHEVFNMIENCPKPVIAAVNGFALGGGCELAMACHIRVASENARFGQPEVNLGLIPGYGGTQRLTRIIGKGRAIELLITGDIISAQDAYRVGLANFLTTPEELMPKCTELLEKVKTKAPLAVGYVIEAANAAFNKKLDGFNTEIELFGKCYTTQDFKEGTTAFMEKRKAQFTGK